MASADQPKKVSTIAIQCSCGKQLSAAQQHIGKRVKCPACGNVTIVPDIKPWLLRNTKITSKQEPEGMSKSTLVMLFSVLAVFAITGASGFVWFLHSTRVAKVEAANEDVRRAIVSANEWLAGTSAIDGESVELKLNTAIGNELAVENPESKSILDKVRQHRQLLAEKARVNRSQLEAAAILRNAKMKLDEGRIEDAQILLTKYINDPYATEKPEAMRFVTEVEIATSADQVLADLMSIADDLFNKTSKTGIIDDGKVSHPTLIDVRKKNIQLNFPIAAKRRNEIKLEEKTRQEEMRFQEEKRVEAERIASMERQREEKLKAEQQEAERLVLEARAPLRVFLGGELRGPAAAYYRLQKEPFLKEIKKTDTGSVFDKADQPSWKDKFAVEYITIAPGVLMDISVANHASDVLYGPHSAWSWTMALAVPDGVTPYQGVSFDVAVGTEIESWAFKLIGTAELDAMTIALYRFQQRFSRGSVEFFMPVDKILSRITRGSATVKYRISTGLKGIGPVHEGELNQRVVQSIVELLGKARQRNQADREPYLHDWMR
jgi:predicted RNA-binding Zn-ribbon protein involved in translation (DUF1610 family)